MIAQKSKDCPLRLVLPSHLHLRKIKQQDTEFLCRLYGSTRTNELAALPWSEEQKAAFVQMQFDAQHRHYQEHYSTATFEVITLDQRDIGRLYLDLRIDEIRIVDIALLPEYRGNRYGSIVLAAILQEAKIRDLPVLIHVEKENPAMELYKRLSFEFVEDKGVYNLLRWRLSSNTN